MPPFGRRGVSMRALQWKAAGVSLALGAVMCGTAPAALAVTARGAAAASWHVVYRAAAGSEIQGIAAPGKKAGWAFAASYATNDALTGFFYLHWNGGEWRRVSIPAAAGFVPQQIEASSPGDVWIFGYRAADLTGEAIVYNGRHWSAMPAPWPEAPSAPEVVAGRADVWLVVQSGCLSQGCTTQVQNWNGSGWQLYQVPGQLELAGGGTHPWLVGLAGSGSTAREVVYRWTGGSWQPVTAPGKAAAQVAGVASPAGRLWLGTKGRSRGPWSLYERVGARWSRLRTPRTFDPTSGPGFPVYDGKSGFWSLPFHWTGTRWIRTMPASRPNQPWWFNTFWYNEVSPVPGTSSSWAVILANVSRTSDTQRFTIAVYGTTP